MNHAIKLFTILFVVQGCSSLSKMSMTEAQTQSGKKISVSQYRPQPKDQCKLLKKEDYKWGLRAHMDENKAYTKMEKTALLAMTKMKEANYAYLSIPADTSIDGFNVNAIADGSISYYHCQNEIQ